MDRKEKFSIPHATTTASTKVQGIRSRDPRNRIVRKQLETWMELLVALPVGARLCYSLLFVPVAGWLPGEVPAVHAALVGAVHSPCRVNTFLMCNKSPMQPANVWLIISKCYVKKVVREGRNC